MKTDHPQPNQPSFSDCPGGSSSISSNTYSTGKFKMPCEQEAWVKTVLGYKVKSSDMAEKLQHLEEAMGQAQQQGISQLGSDTVHSNPSDLSSWLESMIVELNSQPHPYGDLASGSKIIFGDSDYDLKAIPGKAVFPNQNQIIQPVKEELTESKHTAR